MRPASRSRRDNMSRVTRGSFRWGYRPIARRTLSPRNALQHRRPRVTRRDAPSGVQQACRVGGYYDRSDEMHAGARLATLLDEAANDREVVSVRRCGAGGGVAPIGADELPCLLETAHSLRSPTDAERLQAALSRAPRREVAPRSLDHLRREVRLDEGACCGLPARASRRPAVSGRDEPPHGAADSYPHRARRAGSIGRHREARLAYVMSDTGSIFSRSVITTRHRPRSSFRDRG